MNRSVQTAAAASEHAARAGADIMQRGTEIAQQAWDTGSKIAAQLTEQSANQFAGALGLSGEEAQQTAQQSSRNMDAIIGSTAAIAEGMQNISRELSVPKTRFCNNGGADRREQAVI